MFTVSQYLWLEHKSAMSDNLFDVERFWMDLQLQTSNIFS